MPRDQIVSQLMDKVNSGQVTITLGDVTIKPSLRMRNDTSCSSSKDNDDDDDGMGAGAIVGLSIALFTVGLLVGIGLVFLFQWLQKFSKSKYSVTSYKKHQDEQINN